MKKLIFLFEGLFIFLISQNIFSQWYQINNSYLTDNLKDIQLFGNNEVFIAADSNIIYTTDGGTSWSKKIAGFSIDEMEFTDYNTGFAISSKYANNSFRIRKTTNHGLNWTSIGFVPGLPVVSSISQLKVRDANLIYFKLKYTYDYHDPHPPYPSYTITRDEIWITTNGGDSWGRGAYIEAASGSGYSSQSYIQNYWFSKNSNIGYALLNNSYSSGGTSYNCEIYKSTNGFASWELSEDIPKMQGGDIFFVNDTTGYISLYSKEANSIDSGVYRTTNASIDWYNISHFVPANFLFTDYYTAYCFFGYGSSDGGANWIHQFTPVNPTSIKFLNNYTGYICGSGGAIYKTTNGGGLTIGINSYSGSIPDNFILHQNYPNPFNPSTIINYQLVINSFVSLKVYNLQGKEIQTLVNKKQPEGSYSVEFNGINLPSGIYFYTINAGDFKETKKMILIK